MRKRVNRRVKRYLVSLEISQLNGQSSPGATLVDISSLGARLETSQPLPRRSAVQFSVQFPNLAKVCQFAGTVLWVAPLEHRAGRHQIGVQFFNAQWDIDRAAQQGKIGPEAPET